MIHKLNYEDKFFIFLKSTKSTIVEVTLKLSFTARMVFTKAGQRRPAKGERMSPHHLVNCISSGIPSMDTQLLGGGIPVGYVLSIVQDDPSVYWKLFAKFFCAEGLEADHKILLIGRGAKTMARELPESTDSQEKANVSGNAQNEEKLKIAWAYQKQRQPMGRPGISQIPGIIKDNFMK